MKKPKGIPLIKVTKKRDRDYTFNISSLLTL